MKMIIKHYQAVGVKTNNQAEYLGVLFLLVDAYVNGIKKIKVYGDSEVVIYQIIGTYEVKSPNLIPYYAQICKILDNFESA